MPVPIVRVSKRFTVNMGNYESYSPEFSVELPVDESHDDETILALVARATKLVDEAAHDDLVEAAATSDVRNTYILTWLHNREDANAQGNN